jgi:hypothetical protein
MCSRLHNRVIQASADSSVKKVSMLLSEQSLPLVVVARSFSVALCVQQSRVARLAPQLQR